MKIIVTLFIALSFPLMSLMSTPSSLKKEVGIKFVNLIFQKAVQQAKTSNKLVFIDVHTSWCGPCKEMAATTFKDAEVGALFNKNFINLKIDAEKDADGPSVARAYGVRAYPTLLFIDGDGNVVQKVIGKQTKEKLIYIASSLKQ